MDYKRHCVIFTGTYCEKSALLPAGLKNNTVPYIVHIKLVSDFQGQSVSPHHSILMADPHTLGNNSTLRLLLHTDSSVPGTQRENLFHSRCKIDEFTCKLIIDGGSCANVASLTLAERLNLPQRDHHTPYSLNLLNDSSAVRVTKEALVTFSLGELTDTVWCDIVPMTACQLLLGRPWQYDRQVTHDGRENTYTLLWHNVLLRLLPLPVTQV